MIDTKQRRQIPLWTPTVIGVLISVVVGFVFYRQTGDNAATGALAGLIGTTITLQLELLLQHRRTAADELRRDRLLTQIESVPWLHDILERSVTSYQVAARSYSAPIVAEFARKAFEECQGRLQDLQRGNSIYRLVDDSWLYETLTAQARQTLRATCPDTAEELDWWDSAMGGVYLNAQKAAIERGVEVRRVFIYRDWTDRLATLAARHHEIGIKTLRVRSAALKRDSRISMIIWDDFCANEIVLNTDGDAIAARYTVAPQDVENLLREFQLIEKGAEPWHPSAAQ